MKTCFVIMGFGKKIDPTTGKTIDLDKTYKHIIKPCIEGNGVKCVRSDEIQDSGLIDRSMYVMLMRADLVIADITTYNPNALYELGVRHAVRPFSTIIMKESSGNIPFDINHNKIFKYTHMGDDIGGDEIDRCRRELSQLVKEVLANSLVDSPLYSTLTVANLPTISDEEYYAVIGDMATSERSLFAITETANELRRNSKFSEAAEQWEKAAKLVENEPYYIQQWALCRYKSKLPTVLTSLNDAFVIISKLLIDESSIDPETLGLCGAINKRLWEETGDTEYLRRAIDYYEKGYSIQESYYPGENFAECLDMLSHHCNDSDEKIYYKIRAKKIRQIIVKNLEQSIAETENGGPDRKWEYATLSNCYRRLGDIIRGQLMEDKFLSENPESWEIESFNQTKNRGA